MTSWISADDVAAYLCITDLVRAQMLADAVTGAIRDYLTRELEQVTYDELYQTNYTDYILLDNSPISSITSVTIQGYGAIQPVVLGQAGWRLDPQVPRKLQFMGYGRLPRSETPNIEVVYVAGYPIGTPPDAKSSPWFAGTGLPTAIYEAMALTAAAMQNAQAADPNLQSESTAGVFSGTFYPTGVGAIPPGARTLLQAYTGVAP
jgi:hypothetical protein